MNRTIEIYLWSGSENGTKTLIYSTDNPGIYNMIPGTIRSEVNKAGSFEFDIYDFQTFRYSITERLTYVSVEDAGFDVRNNSRYLFYGRVQNITVDITGHWHVTCEGLLADLMDIPLYMPSSDAGGKDSKYGIWRLYTQSSDYLFRYALTAYNELSGKRNIVCGVVDNTNYVINETDDEEDNDYFNYEYPWDQTVGDFILNELVNNYGGIIRVYYSYDSSINGIKGTVNWGSDPVSNPDGYTTDPNQSIIYGENVLDASIETINDDLIDSVFPTWTQIEKKKSDGDNETKESIKYWLQSFNSTTGHYEPGLVYPPYLYHPGGAIKHVDFDKAHSESTARSMALKYVNVYHQKVNYKITTRILDNYWITGEYSEPISVMLRKYRVNIPFPGKEIDEELLCLSSEIDITNPSNNTYLFGPYVPPDILKTRYLTGR